MALGILMCYSLYVICFGVGVCWLWPEFVDDNPYGRIRKLLLGMLGVLATAEAWLYYRSVIGPKLLAVVLLANGWGMLDALLRYPIAHDLDTPFGIKQLVLFMMKFVGYIAGLRADMEAGWLMLCVWSNVLTLPLLWLMAVPVEVQQKHSSVDADIAIRLFQLFSRPEERARVSTLCKRVRRHCWVHAVTAAPALRPLALRWDPSLAPVLRKAIAV